MVPPLAVPYCDALSPPPQKPSNIFVALDGCLKLGDLGLSRYFSSRTLQVFGVWWLVGCRVSWKAMAMEGAGYLSESFHFLPDAQAVSQVGTPYYMSPGVGIIGCL